MFRSVIPEHATMMEGDISLDIPVDLFPPDNQDSPAAAATAAQTPNPGNADSSPGEDSLPGFLTAGKTNIRPSDSFLTSLFTP